MKVTVKVIPKSSRSLVKVEGERLKAYVSAAPEKGKANKALIDLLASTFGVNKKDVRILHGKHTPLKIVEIITENVSSSCIKKS
jgi:uncharacterized protein (TIGR00251 family)